MKKIFSIYIVFLLLMLSAAAQLKENSSLDKFNWLLGTWERENVKEGSSAFESWTKESDVRFIGKGVTMKGNDTTFVEKLSLIIKDNELYYTAEVSHNAEPTYFKIIGLSATGFVCENPEHDFPKKIEYKLEPEAKLTATISGDGKTIPFVFKKVN